MRKSRSLSDNAFSPKISGGIPIEYNAAVTEIARGSEIPPLFREYPNNPTCSFLFRRLGIWTATRFIRGVRARICLWYPAAYRLIREMAYSQSISCAGSILRSSRYRIAEIALFFSVSYLKADWMVKVYDRHTHQSPVLPYRAGDYL